MFYYERMSYTDVLKSADSSFATFECEYPCMFLVSMAEDGYDGFLKLSTENKQHHEYSVYCIDKVQDIYVPQRNCYGTITIKKIAPKTYSVNIEIRPSGFDKDSDHDSFMSAISKMGGSTN